MLRRHHKQLNREMVVIQPGEYYVTDRDEVIATLLGSCISVCLRDADSKIGGMNHFMLPGDFTKKDVFSSNSGRYGMYAMELLIGDILKMGGGRNLRAKVFGGAHVLNSVPHSARTVPQANIEFIKSFLSMEGIPVDSSNVGGRYGRKVLYLPRGGKAYVKQLIPEDTAKLAKKEQKYERHIERETKDQDLTLF